MSDCEDLTLRLEDSLVAMKTCGMKWIPRARKYLEWRHAMERLARREETESGRWLDHARNYELLKEKRGCFFEWCLEMEKESDSIVEASFNAARPKAYKAWRRDMEEMIRLEEKDSQRWHEYAFNQVVLRQERESFSRWCLEMGRDAEIGVVKDSQSSEQHSTPTIFTPPTMEMGRDAEIGVVKDSQSSEQHSTPTIFTPPTMSDCEDLTSRLEYSLGCMETCRMKWIPRAREYLEWLHEMERMARLKETDSGSWLDHAREYELLKEKRAGFFEWCVEMEKVSDSLVEAGHNEDRPIAYKAWRRDMEREMVRLDEKDSQRRHENAFNHVALKQERENFSKWCLEMGIDSEIAVDVFDPSEFEDDDDAWYGIPCPLVPGELDEVIKDSDEDSYDSILDADSDKDDDDSDAMIADDDEDDDDSDTMIADDDEDDDDSDAMIDADDEDDDDSDSIIGDDDKEDDDEPDAIFSDVELDAIFSYDEPDAIFSGVKPDAIFSYDEPDGIFSDVEPDGIFCDVEPDAIFSDDEPDAIFSDDEEEEDVASVPGDNSSNNNNTFPWPPQPPGPVLSSIPGK